MRVINIGILGLGTVGQGVVNVLLRNAEEIRRRSGCHINLQHIVIRDRHKARPPLPTTIKLSDDPYQLINDPNIDIIVELIGGIDTAKTLLLAAMAQGKHVVTANKALLALHGNALVEHAQSAEVMLAFEAAVGGGIPILKALREGLAANRIARILGIVNGTCNFILTQMHQQRISFSVALREAQRLGYAEADPRFDIEGQDSAHKLAILAALAFGTPIPYQGIHTEGIAQLNAQDIDYAEQLGYRLKLLAIAKRHAHGISLRVHPALIPKQRILANVDGVMNAVLIQGDAVGQTVYSGAGAGAEATASAVIADIIDISRLCHAHPEQRVPYLAFQAEALRELAILPIDSIHSAYYLRLHALDKPGVMATITRLLAEQNISIEAMLQKQPALGEDSVDIIIVTHQTQEAAINKAIDAIEALNSVVSAVIKLRLEACDEAS